MDWRFRITWVEVPRWPRPPLWAAGVVLAWALLLALLHWLELRFGAAAETCPFHWLTGRPCATCGSTRAALALLQGHPLVALRLNPLITSAMVLTAALLLLRLFSGRSPGFLLGKHTRLALWILAIGLFLGNWIWVLRTLG